MPQRLLRLGTRRSALARAQSAQVARALEQLRPSVRIELVGIDTRGDRSSATPLAQMQGKEFFTAEIDAALLDGAVDFTVHSYKDLSLERAPRLLLAAVPQREPPQDVVLFAADVRARLAAGAELRIGSSSPRRAAFVPEFLRQALPGASVARVRLCELRGNVDTRLRRLHEAADSERRLDGVVLALAGLVRLWRDEAGRTLLQGLLAGLPRMLLPLSTCPTAPAQGALAVECRREDQATAELLAPLEHAPTRQAVAAERALLAARGGGCHQRFGATQMTLPRPAANRSCSGSRRRHSAPCCSRWWPGTAAASHRDRSRS
jgi:hydroxymethylbilane synthase